MYRPAFKTSDTFIEQLPPEEGEVSVPLFSIVQEIKSSEKVYVGVYPRYFTLHRSDKQIIEVNRNTYENLRAKSPRFDHLLYIIGMLTWDTTNPVQDVMQGKYLLEGSNTKNLREVEKLEKTLPGLKDYLVLKGELSI